MALLHFHLPSFPASSSFKPKPNPNPNPKPSLSLTPPARDLTIDFGRHKGRMLGTLPSSYLSWISSTLRTGDSLRWAHLADEVLADPVYRDRIEWELAQNLLSGNSSNMQRSMSDSPVSDLLELSQRFGWDNEDKEGWARVNFELLGTSKGGRIPRIGDGGGEKSSRAMVGGGGKREERRERKREKRMGKMVDKVEDRKRLEFESRGRNPFPGRRALIDKINRGGGGSDGLDLFVN